MKTFTLATLGASALVVVAAPAIAHQGMAYKFSYFASELASETARDGLLKRMQLTTQDACAGRKSKAYISSAKCREDLEKQFIAAIDNPQLLAQYEGKAIRIARSDR